MGAVGYLFSGVRVSPRVLLIGVAGVSLMVATATTAAPITGDDIVLIPSGVTGSGNGTLDVRLMTFSGAEIPNDSGSFNADNANNSLPNLGGEDTYSFDESWVTTAGELQAYYTLNFDATTTGESEVVLFLDLNETGAGPAQTNELSLLDIVLNPTTIQGDPNPAGDVLARTTIPTSDYPDGGQNDIDQIFTGGSTVANLNPEPAANIPVNSQGAGFADYAIFTGIDPFAYAGDDVLLFNISMDFLNNGAEEVFLSGTFSGQDVMDAIPEPGTALLFGSGMIGLAWAGRRRVR